MPSGTSCRSASIISRPARSDRHGVSDRNGIASGIVDPRLGNGVGTVGVEPIGAPLREVGVEMRPGVRPRRMNEPAATVFVRGGLAAPQADLRAAAGGTDVAHAIGFAIAQQLRRERDGFDGNVIHCVSPSVIQGWSEVSSRGCCCVTKTCRRASSFGAPQIRTFQQGIDVFSFDVDLLSVEVSQATELILGQFHHARGIVLQTLTPDERAGPVGERDAVVSARVRDHPARGEANDLNGHAKLKIWINWNISDGLTSCYVYAEQARVDRRAEPTTRVHLTDAGALDGQTRIVSVLKSVPGYHRFAEQRDSGRFVRECNGKFFSCKKASISSMFPFLRRITLIPKVVW